MVKAQGLKTPAISHGNPIPGPQLKAGSGGQALHCWEGPFLVSHQQPLPKPVSPM